MVWRSVAILVTVLCMSGCGKDPTAKAIDACAAAVAQKVEGKAYKLDHAAMQASAADDGTGVISMSGGLIVNPGMSNEEKQAVQCKARVTDNGADVVSLTLIWQ